VLPQASDDTPKLNAAVAASARAPVTILREVPFIASPYLSGIAGLCSPAIGNSMHVFGGEGKYKGDDFAVLTKRIRSIPLSR
jgi:hypothetical protein